MLEIKTSHKNENEKTKAQNEMKRLAKQGQMESVRHLAKDIVRMKKSESQFIKMKAELRSLSMQMETMSATSQLQTSIRTVSRMMGMISNQIKLPELQVCFLVFLFSFYKK